MTYLNFLKMLIALGPKLPQVMALVQHIVSDVQEIVALVSGEETFTAEAAINVSEKEQAAEGEVLAALEGTETFGAIGDGTLLRAMFAFIKAHPELMSLLLSLLKL